MNYATFRRDKPASLPPNISPVYFELYKRVPEYGGYDNAQTITFCIAYTLYSLRKKDTVLRVVQNHGDATQAFTQYQEEWAQKDVIDIAKQFLDGVVNELKLEAAANIAVEIRNALQPQIPWWKRLFGFFTNSFFHVFHLTVGTIIFLSIFGAAIYLWPDFVSSVFSHAEHILRLVRPK